MTKSSDNKKTINISLDLPEDIAAIIEHHAVMRAKDPAEILREVVQKMMDDHGKEVAGALADK